MACRGGNAATKPPTPSLTQKDTVLISETGNQFVFTKGELTTLLSVRVKPNDQAHQSLAALWVYPALGQAWVTDGHRAIMAESSHPPTKAPPNQKSFAFAAETAVKMAKAADTNDLVVVGVGGKTVRVEVRTPKKGLDVVTADGIEKVTDAKIHMECPLHVGGVSSIDHVFPDYSKTPNRAATPMVAAAYLKSAGVLAKVSTTDGVWGSVSHELEPVLLTTHGRHDTTWRMLIMPRKSPAGESSPSDRGSRPRSAAKVRTPSKKAA